MFLLLALVVLGGVVPVVSLQTGFRRPLAGVSVLAVACWWLAGYRRGSFSLVLDITGSIIIGFAVVALGKPVSWLTVLWVSLYFRSLFPRVVLGGLAHAGPLAAALLASDQAGGLLGFSHAVLACLGFGFAGFAHLLAGTLTRHEHALQREQALHHAARRLLSARSLRCVNEVAAEVWCGLDSPDDARRGRSEARNALTATLDLARKTVALSQDLEHSEARFRSLIQNARDVILVVDDRGSVRYATPSVDRMLGYTPGYLEGTPVAALVSGGEQFVADPGKPMPCLWRCRDGSWRETETVATDLVSDPAVRGVVYSIRDVTEQKALEERLVHLRLHDSLTGLPNRVLLRDRINQARARQSRSGKPLGLLLLDLEDFTAHNESLGHARADQILIAVARRIRAQVRRADTVARLGGDEFAVLMEELPAGTDAATVASRVATAFDEPYLIDEQKIRVCARLGVTIASDGEPDELLRQAEVALLRARASSNGIALFDPVMQEDLRRRLEMKSELEHALEVGELEVYFQPIIALDRMTIEGAEALIRWRHPSRGLLPPSEFLPAAERANLMANIGQFVLRESCLAARGWQEEHPHSRLSVNVNFAASHLACPDLLEQVRAVLDETGMDPECLVVELTETELMEKMDVTVAALKELRALGLRVAIDDFGMGYSSLYYLRRLPVDILKVDRSFVAGLVEGPEEAALARAIVKLGQALHLEVVAEGIEFEEQLRELRRVDCQKGQGYLFSRPLPAEEFRAFLAERSYADLLPRGRALRVG